MKSFFLVKLMKLTLLIIAAFTTIPANALAAPALDIRQVDISAEILSSGSMRVIEKHTIHFYDLSRGATMSFSAADELKFSDV